MRKNAPRKKTQIARERRGTCKEKKEDEIVLTVREGRKEADVRLAACWIHREISEEDAKEENKREVEGGRRRRWRRVFLWVCFFTLLLFLSLEIYL